MSTREGSAPRSLLATIEEPATFATDWLMAACAGVWSATLLSALNGAGVPARLVWGAAFGATALSALLGGVVHGFQRRMGARVAQPLWRATLHLVTLTSAGMLAGAILVFPAARMRTLALALVGAKLVAATVLIARDARFGVALADHAVALAAVLALQGGAWWAYGAPSAPWVVAGVAAFGAAGAVQSLGVAPHARFNHNDLSHVVQILALWLFYRGGLLLGVD